MAYALFCQCSNTFILLQRGKMSRKSGVNFEFPRLPRGAGPETENRPDAEGTGAVSLLRVFRKEVAGTPGRLLCAGDKELHPVRVNDRDTDMGIGGVQDIGAVVGRTHHRLNHGLGGSKAEPEVFPD